VEPNRRTLVVVAWPVNPDDARRLHPRVKPRIEFIPFPELPPELLPSKDKLVVEQEFILSPEQGVLEPGSEPVWLVLPDGVNTAGDQLDVPGMSLREGLVLLLVRPAGADGWRIPPPDEQVQVKPGLRFLVPIRLDESANQFEVVAVVVPSRDHRRRSSADSPWATVVADR